MTQRDGRERKGRNIKRREGKGRNTKRREGKGREGKGYELGKENGRAVIER